MAVLRPETLAVQNNMAEASQHIENGLSMATIKTSPPVIVTEHDVKQNTITGLANNNN